MEEYLTPYQITIVFDSNDHKQEALAYAYDRAQLIDIQMPQAVSEILLSPWLLVLHSDMPSSLELMQFTTRMSWSSCTIDEIFDNFPPRSAALYVLDHILCGQSGYTQVYSAIASDNSQYLRAGMKFQRVSMQTLMACGMRTMGMVDSLVACGKTYLEVRRQDLQRCISQGRMITTAFGTCLVVMGKHGIVDKLPADYLIFVKVKNNQLVLHAYGWDAKDLLTNYGYACTDYDTGCVIGKRDIQIGWPLL